MNKIKITFFLLVCGLAHLSAQTSYTSYFTGNPDDAEASPTGGSVLMGGAGENDQAMTWFLNRADGGDILVLRASGSDGYNDYLFSELGVSVNSVETIVFNTPAAASDPYVLDKISRAEGIWFAGGDQWNYVSFWRGTEVATSINEAVNVRGAVVGGISAGMAIMGSVYFSAENGTVTSNQALNNPYHPNVTVDTGPFLSIDYLNDVITDTHYDDPDRKGRHAVFMARMVTDHGINARGIACDEFTAICIDPAGLARVYGEFPSFDDNAYFIQTNCNLSDFGPETCATDQPLDWNLDGEALYVYQVKGTADGSNTFNLADWETGSGGQWQFWSVDDGSFTEADGVQIECLPLSTEDFISTAFSIYPNPARDLVNIDWNTQQLEQIEVYDIKGIRITQINAPLGNQLQISTAQWSPGVYFLRLTSRLGQQLVARLIKS